MDNFHEELQEILEAGGEIALSPIVKYDFGWLHEIRQKVGYDTFNSNVYVGKEFENEPFCGDAYCHKCEKTFELYDLGHNFLDNLGWANECSACDGGHNSQKEIFSIAFIKKYCQREFQQSHVTADSFSEMLFDYHKAEPMRIIKQLKGLQYPLFLQTRYWHIISHEVKKRAKNRCSLDYETQDLEVHHRTYLTHGREIENLEDLTCLCRKCHSKFHNKN